MARRDGTSLGHVPPLKGSSRDVVSVPDGKSCRKHIFAERLSAPVPGLRVEVLRVEGLRVHSRPEAGASRRQVPGARPSSKRCASECDVGAVHTADYAPQPPALLKTLEITGFRE